MAGAAEGDQGTESRLRTIAAAFVDPGAYRGGERLGRGHIHETWAVRFEPPGTTPGLVLQQLNTDVFPDPVRLMENVVRTTAHLRASLLRDAIPEPERRCLRVVPTLAGETFHRRPDGSAWRAFERIPDAVTLERLEDPAQATEAARAFGDFARRLADLPSASLWETLPRFHDFAARLTALERAAASDPRGRASEVRPELEALRHLSRELQRALDSAGLGELPRRVVHHDCKLNNLLFDASGVEALCVIDLDTVMPGTLLSDFGELVRSGTNTGAEDEADLDRVDFDAALYAGVAEGYLDGLGTLTEEAERRALPLAGPLLTVMNAVRFLTDHLQGDVYFRIGRPGHNLDRARAQLRLAQRMLAHEDALRAPFG